jgi:hypothetical protein
VRDRRLPRSTSDGGLPESNGSASSCAVARLSHTRRAYTQRLLPASRSHAVHLAPIGAHHCGVHRVPVWTGDCRRIIATNLANRVLTIGTDTFSTHLEPEWASPLRADTWGQGLGVEAVQITLALPFDHLGLHHVWTARLSANVASEKTISNHRWPRPFLRRPQRQDHNLPTFREQLRQAGCTFDDPVQP